MTSVPTAHQLHLWGMSLREKDNLFESLGFLSQAIYLYHQEGNFGGLVDAIQDRVLNWKHLFLNTKDPVFTILAQKDAESSLEITLTKNLTSKLYSSYFRLGEIAMIKDDYSNAINFYKKAIQKFPKENAEMGDYVYHLGEALYLTGKKAEGKQAILKGLSLLNKYKSETDSFLINVWTSGAYRRLAELLKNDEPTEAINFLNDAKKIADKDERLIIRKRQIAEVEADFKKSGLI